VSVFHVLTSGNGNIDFLKAFVAGAAGTTSSVTMFGPHFDIDVDGWGKDTWLHAKFDRGAGSNKLTFKSRCSGL